MNLIKKVSCAILFAFIMNSCFANIDTIMLHNGERIYGEILSVSNYTIQFKYKGEKAEQQLSKYAIEKIHFESGRKQSISSKIIISGESDWEKVTVLEDKSQHTGLTKISNIRANTKFINLHTANSGDITVSEKLLKEAAKLGCPFILIIYERATVYNGLIKSWGAVQEIKKAICFNY